MPILLRRFLTCFYCGQRSQQRFTSGLRQWDCRNCEATNYLDENGQITDPPIPPTPSPSATKHYAHQIPRATAPGGPANINASFTSAVSFAEPDPIFCKTCLKNQHLFTQSLASYLPPTTDPKYAEYEASYPEYKRRLEARYPQVCRDCAPKVETKIREAAYTAQTDHLKRLMERSKRGAAYTHYLRTGRLTWGRIAIFVGGFAWWGSVGAQMLWHAFGALMDFALDDGLREEVDPILGLSGWLDGCTRRSLANWEVGPECLTETVPLARWSLILAVCSVWWYNKLSVQYNQKFGGRIEGLRDYYTMQLVILPARMAAVYFLQNPKQPPAGISAMAFRGCHSFMLLLLVVTTAILRSQVTVIPKPVIFRAPQPAPLLPEPIPQRGSSTHQLASKTPKFTFPTAALAPGHTTPRTSRSTRTMTPGTVDPYTYPPSPTLTDEDDVASTATSTTDLMTEWSIENRMEWTPTGPPAPAFLPRRAPPTPHRYETRLRAKETEAEASPFYGRLPAAPIPPAHRARNPFLGPQPAQKKKEQAPRNPFADPGRQNLDTALGSKRKEYALQEGRFKYKDRKGAEDTGLEGLFTDAFRIADEPVKASKDAEGQCVVM